MHLLLYDKVNSNGLLLYITTIVQISLLLSSHHLFSCLLCFSEGSVVVDAVLVFNGMESVPDSKTVIETLVAAIASDDFPEELNLNSSSIKAERKMQKN